MQPRRPALVVPVRIILQGGGGLDRRPSGSVSYLVSRAVAALASARVMYPIYRHAHPLPIGPCERVRGMIGWLSRDDVLHVAIARHPTTGARGARTKADGPASIPDVPGSANHAPQLPAPGTSHLSLPGADFWFGCRG